MQEKNEKIFSPGLELNDSTSTACASRRNCSNELSGPAFGNNTLVSYNMRTDVLRLSLGTFSFQIAGDND